MFFKSFQFTYFPSAVNPQKAPALEHIGHILMSTAMGRERKGNRKQNKCWGCALCVGGRYRDTVYSRLISVNLAFRLIYNRSLTMNGSGEGIELATAWNLNRCSSVSHWDRSQSTFPHLFPLFFQIFIAKTISSKNCECAEWAFCFTYWQKAAKVILLSVRDGWKFRQCSQSPRADTTRPK